MVRKQREKQWHVVHLTSVHRPFDTRIFHKQCRSLAKAGYEVFLVSRHPVRETLDGVTLVPAAVPSGRPGRMTLGVWRVFRQALKLRADLYHFHDPELMGVGVLLKALTGAKLVYDVHENYPVNIMGKTWLPSHIKPLLSRAAVLAEKAMALAADGVVTVLGPPLSSRFPPGKTIVVKNFALQGPEEFLPGEERLMEGNFRLIYTGGLTAHRGARQIVAALDHVGTPGARLTILGPEPDAAEGAAIRSLPGFSRVDYLGMVPIREVYSRMKAAAVGLICPQPVFGYHLASPNKLYEYMSTGLPVVASDLPAWDKELHGHGCGIAVDSTDPKAIAAAIDRLLGDPALRKKMGDRGRRAFLQEYNWGREEKKLLALYARLLP